MYRINTVPFSDIKIKEETIIYEREQLEIYKSLVKAKPQNGNFKKAQNFLETQIKEHQKELDLVNDFTRSTNVHKYGVSVKNPKKLAYVLTDKSKPPAERFRIFKEETGLPNKDADVFIHHFSKLLKASNQREGMIYKGFRHPWTIDISERINIKCRQRQIQEIEEFADRTPGQLLIAVKSMEQIYYKLINSIQGKQNKMHNR